MKAERVIGLDVVRVIAITMVVLFHSSPILFPLKDIPKIGGLLARLIAAMIPLGILGVDLFFVLSGFLIGTILIKVFLHSKKYGFTEIKNFLVRRWFRTLPNYWLILIINIIVYTLLHQEIQLRYFIYIPNQVQPYIYHSPVSILTYFVFIQNLWHAPPAFFLETWSLAIEEWFYLTLPLAILIAATVFRNVSKQRIILITFISYSLVFLLLRLFGTDWRITNPLYFDLGIRSVVMFRLDAIGYGFFMAYLFLFHKERVLAIKNKLLFVSITGVVATTLVYYVAKNTQLNFYQNSVAYRVFINAFSLTLIPLFFSMCIPYASAVRTIKHKKTAIVITTISKISYSMYLIHRSLIYLPFFPFRYTVRNCIPYYIFYWIIVIALSLLLFTFFENPVMNLRKRFSKDDPAI